MTDFNHLNLSLLRRSRDINSTRDEKTEICLSSEDDEPGKMSQTLERNDDGHDNAHTVFRTVSLSTRQPMKTGLENVINYLKNLGSPDLLRYNLVALFTISLEDRDFALKTAIVYGAIHTTNIGKETVQSIIFLEIQKELKSNTFCRGNRERFLNTVFFVSEIYFHTRSNNKLFLVLGEKLLQCFFWLLTGRDGELEVLATCLIINGVNLKKDHPVSYTRLLVQIRVTLLSRKISKIGKSWILLIVDMDHLNFRSLPEDLKICYMPLIGDQGFKILQRMRLSHTLGSERILENASECTKNVELSAKEQLPKATPSTECTHSNYKSKPPAKRQYSSATNPGPSRPNMAKKLRASQKAIFPECEHSGTDSNSSNVSSSNVALPPKDQLPKATPSIEYRHSNNRSKPPAKRQYSSATTPGSSRLSLVKKLRALGRAHVQEREHSVTESNSLNVSSRNVELSEKEQLPKATPSAEYKHSNYRSKPPARRQYSFATKTGSSRLSLVKKLRALGRAHVQEREHSGTDSNSWNVSSRNVELSPKEQLPTTPNTECRHSNYMLVKKLRALDSAHVQEREHSGTDSKSLNVSSSNVTLSPKQQLPKATPSAEYEHSNYRSKPPARSQYSSATKPGSSRLSLVKKLRALGRAHVQEREHSVTELNSLNVSSSNVALSPKEQLPKATLSTEYKHSNYRSKPPARWQYSSATKPGSSRPSLVKKLRALDRANVQECEHSGTDSKSLNVSSSNVPLSPKEQLAKATSSTENRQSTNRLVKKLRALDSAHVQECEHSGTDSKSLNESSSNVELSPKEQLPNASPSTENRYSTNRFVKKLRALDKANVQECEHPGTDSNRLNVSSGNVELSPKEQLPKTTPSTENRHSTNRLVKTLGALDKANVQECEHPGTDSNSLNVSSGNVALSPKEQLPKATLSTEYKHSNYRSKPPARRQYSSATKPGSSRLSLVKKLRALDRDNVQECEHSGTDSKSLNDSSRNVELSPKAQLPTTPSTECRRSNYMLVKKLRALDSAHVQEREHSGTDSKSLNVSSSNVPLSPKEQLPNASPSTENRYSTNRFVKKLRALDKANVQECEHPGTDSNRLNVSSGNVELSPKEQLPKTTPSTENRHSTNRLVKTLGALDKANVQECEHPGTDSNSLNVSSGNVALSPKEQLPKATLSTEYKHSNYRSKPPARRQYSSATKPGSSRLSLVKKLRALDRDNVQECEHSGTDSKSLNDSSRNVELSPKAQLPTTPSTECRRSNYMLVKKLRALDSAHVQEREHSGTDSKSLNVSSSNVPLSPKEQLPNASPSTENRYSTNRFVKKLRALDKANVQECEHPGTDSNRLNVSSGNVELSPKEQLPKTTPSTENRHSTNRLVKKLRALDKANVQECEHPGTDSNSLNVSSGNVALSPKEQLPKATLSTEYKHSNYRSKPPARRQYFSATKPGSSRLSLVKKLRALDRDNVQECEHSGTDSKSLNVSSRNVELSPKEQLPTTPSTECRRSNYMLVKKLRALDSAHVQEREHSGTDSKSLNVSSSNVPLSPKDQLAKATSSTEIRHSTNRLVKKLRALDSAHVQKCEHSGTDSKSLNVSSSNVELSPKEQLPNASPSTENRYSTNRFVKKLRALDKANVQECEHPGTDSNRLNVSSGNVELSPKEQLPKATPSTENRHSTNRLVKKLRALDRANVQELVHSGTDSKSLDVSSGNVELSPKEQLPTTPALPVKTQSSPVAQPGPSRLSLEKKLRALDRAIFSEYEHCRSDADKFNDGSSDSSMSVSHLLNENDGHEDDDNEWKFLMSDSSDEVAVECVDLISEED